ncbi:MAG: hypothetical protein FWG67_01290 [Defluviitaleaceae bacterium]|nr:hypothetical protein [Defluviitaleaceae bacterium]
MREISIGIAGWRDDLRGANDALWGAKIIKDSAIQLEDNTLADLTQFQTLLHELNALVIDYLEVAASDVIKMREVGNRVAESDEMLRRMWGDS